MATILEQIENLEKELKLLKERLVLMSMKPKQPDKAPDGFVFTGEYRDVNPGEWYQSTGDPEEAYQRVNPTFVFANSPRWILRKRKTWTFVETGEIRYLNYGDFYRRDDGKVSMWAEEDESLSEYMVVEQIEE